MGLATAQLAASSTVIGAPLSQSGPASGVLIALWFGTSFGFSLTRTPIGRIINRSTGEADLGVILPFLCH